jgi:uncharacterized protein (DUF1800 family)
VATNIILAVGSASALAAAAVVTVATVLPTTPQSGVTTLASGSGTTSASVSAFGAVTDADAARLAKQATFGPTPAVIARIKELGIKGWLDEQFALKSSSYADLAAMEVRNSYCDTDGKAIPSCFRVYRDSVLPAMRFYANAVQGDDQLRQRVALALFNIMPVSALKVSDTAALARYQQIMLDYSLGNFADLLRAVILSGAMGSYLDNANSTAAIPNENLARELMQLFSIGPNAINADGVARTDATGALVPNYTTTDVTEVARALTGWTYATLPGAPQNRDTNDLSKPLVAALANFDPRTKTFLGTTISAGASQSSNIDAVVKRLTGDPSTAPRITRLLIQALVRSNPSPGYIFRAARLFRNNGAGVTGDLRALVRAILTDPEARYGPDYTVNSGKLKDPILLATSLARVVGLRTDGYAFTVRDVQMGQQFLRGPSIFGDYPPDFPLQGSTNRVSPPSKLMTVATIFERHNFVWQWTMGGDSARGEYATPSWVPKATRSAEDWSQWEQFGADIDGMIDRIDLLMLASTMTRAQRASLRNAMTLVSDPSPTLQARRRAQTGIYIVASSPQFQIER